MSIDPRLLERRRHVAEEHAKRNVHRLLRFLAILAVAGAMVWFALSPYLSVQRIAIEGVVESATAGILAAHSVVPGTPMILLRPGAVVESLEGDPWVVEAEVRFQWPNDVVVTVWEREPRAWVQTADGWARRAEDGHAVPSRDTPDNTLGWVRLPTVGGDEAAASDLVRGSIEFLMALPAEMARLSSVRYQDGELWAAVDGYQVRLGRAVEMREKALSLVTLLDEGIPKTSLIVVVAPTHPAVRPTDANGGHDNGAEEEGGRP